jgi:hypothetical protein
MVLQGLNNRDMKHFIKSAVLGMLIPQGLKPPRYFVPDRRHKCLLHPVLENIFPGLKAQA